MKKVQERTRGSDMNTTFFRRFLKELVDMLKEGKTREEIIRHIEYYLN